MTVPSGLLLFVCLFLPAADSCNGPIVPLEWPPLWWPHVIGGLAAGSALCGRPIPWSQLGAMRTRAVAWLGAGLVSMGWLAWLCRDGAVLVGLPLALVAATGLTLGWLVWLRDLRAATSVPRARLRGARGARRCGLGLTALVALELVAVLAVLRYVPFAAPPQPPLPTVPINAQMLCLGMCGC
ncbi:MAG: hypothetical protein IPL61_30465 [Myxococcales bacterium]|nr:hypothetical protein [Myxococcales bacterium]